MKGLGAFLLLALALAGCGRKPATSEPTATAAAGATDATGTTSQAVASTAKEVGDVQSLQHLVDSSPSPVVQNNARAALDAWKQKDYGSAVVFLKTVMSLPEAQLQATEISGVLSAMQAELQRAASGGNRAAQQALQDLAPPSP